MRKVMAVKTDRGKRVVIHLDNWGGGVDRQFRRWVREHDGWRCLETGELGRKTNLLFGSLFAARGLPRNQPI